MDSLRIPGSLLWWRSRPDGARWLDKLPAVVALCLQRWRLQLGPPFESHASFTAAVVDESGREAVLKVNFPDRDSEGEPDALAAWQGAVSVRLLASDPFHRALLVERCRPGDQLWSIEDDVEATRIAASVMRRLWQPPEPGHRFPTLADEAARWSEELPRHYERHGRPFERAILEEAVAASRELGPHQGEVVILHQDLHGGNILRAQREPWLVIDPKPLAGEREFDVASLLRDRRRRLGQAGGRQIVRRRLDQLHDELGLDRERMRLWGIVHALAWGIDDEQPGSYSEEHVLAARLLHEAR